MNMSLLSSCRPKFEDDHTSFGWLRLAALLRHMCSTPNEAVAASPNSLWTSIFGEALSSSPGTRRRNKQINDLTPGGHHLSDKSAAWLARHQTKAQSRLERKVASKLERRPPKAGNAAGGCTSLIPIAVRGWPGRMPPQAQRGREPQVICFEMDVLAERYRESLWDRQLMTTARPGLIRAAGRLRERFLLCALVHAPVGEAVRSSRACPALRHPRLP